MMRVLRGSFVLILLLVTIGVPSARIVAEEGESMVTIIDGKSLQSNRTPFIEGRKLFLPLRAVLEQMGWIVKWNPEYVALTYETQNSTSTTYLYYASEKNIRMQDDITYVTATRLGELTNSLVEWDAEMNSVTITSGEPERIRIEYGIGQEEAIEEDSKPALTQEESERINFGKYAVPPTLQALLKADEELAREGYDMWKEIGFTPALYHSVYFNTPVDVVAFGWTGADGDHYGFLTDFGSATDLENAPIVMVTPMSFEQPAVVVANNIREFMSIVIKDPSLLYMAYEDEQSYLESELESQESLEREESEEDRLNKNAVMNRLAASIDLPIIEDHYQYFKNMANERGKRIIVATKDRLGVTNLHPSDTGKQHSSLIVDEDLEVKELRTFLKTATFAAKLAVIRDYNLEVLEYEQDILETLKNEMLSMGLVDELARMAAID